MDNNSLPENRINSFYDERDFLFDTKIGNDIIKHDSGFKLLFYKIDRNKTLIDDVYGETRPGDIVYLPPVELSILVTIAPSVNQTYNKTNSSLKQEFFGGFEFTITNMELKEKNVEIMYGDVVGYKVDDKMRFFSVSDPNYITNTNQMLYNTKTYFKRIRCVVLDKKEFNG